ncbi:MAG: cytochrome c biogenesis protein ResB [Myxococcales bacterium]|nr:cytochrome c biogenesis protein ResB [Myxococcales bacterium]
MAKKPKIQTYTKRRDPIWELFASVKLTIPLVLILAVASIVGTVIKQFPTEQDLQALYSPAQIEWFKRLSLFDAYHSWWYQLCLVLLATNLIVCSIERIPGVWRVIRNPRERLGDAAWKSMPMNRVFTAPDIAVEPAMERLEKALGRRMGRRRTFEVSGERQMFAEVGRFSRMAPYLVHVSLLVIMAGAMLGSAFGYRGSMNIFEGETERQVTQFNAVGPPVGLPFAIRCDDFDVKFYPDGTPRDFKSNVAILDPQGNVVHEETLRVNHPMKWEGIRFYQASYGQSARIKLEMWPGAPELKAKLPAETEAAAAHAGLAPMRRTADGEPAAPVEPIKAPPDWPTDKPLHELDFNLWDAVRFPRYGTTLQVIDLQPDFGGFGPAAKIGLERANGEREMFWLFQRFPTFDAQSRGGPEVFVFRGAEPWFYTGIQVTKDPGVEIVWIGCSMLMAGLVFAFFYSHRRLWLRVTPKGGGVEVTVAGAVNKNKLAYEREFDKLVNDLRAALGLPPEPIDERGRVAPIEAV